jgi:hypothetical protein
MSLFWIGSRFFNELNPFDRFLDLRLASFFGASDLAGSAFSIHDAVTNREGVKHRRAPVLDAEFARRFPRFGLRFCSRILSYQHDVRIVL